MQSKHNNKNKSILSLLESNVMLLLVFNNKKEEDLDLLFIHSFITSPINLVYV